MILSATLTAWRDALDAELRAADLDPRAVAARTLTDVARAIEHGEAWAAEWLWSDEAEGWCALLGIVPERIRREVLSRYLAEMWAPPAAKVLRDAGLLLALCVEVGSERAVARRLRCDENTVAKWLHRARTGEQPRPAGRPRVHTADGVASAPGDRRAA